MDTLASPVVGPEMRGNQYPRGSKGVSLPNRSRASSPAQNHSTVPTSRRALPAVPAAAATFPPRSTVSWTFFRKSRSRQRLESRMVVAYVDSVMSRLGRHLSIQAALEEWAWPEVDSPYGLQVGSITPDPARLRQGLQGLTGSLLCTGPAAVRAALPETGETLPCSGDMSGGGGALDETTAYSPQVPVRGHVVVALQGSSSQEGPPLPTQQPTCAPRAPLTV